MGLVITTTLCWVSGRPRLYPFYTDAEMRLSASRWRRLAILIVACIGWLFTGGLHRHLLALLEANPGGSRKPPAPGGHRRQSRPASRRPKP